MLLKKNRCKWIRYLSNLRHKGYMAASRIYGLFAAAIFLAVLSLALFQSDVIRAATLLKPEGANSTVPISLPHTALSDAKSRSVIYTVSIDHKFYGSAKWNMIADDCIREISVNKHSIDLASTQGNLCDIHKGITVDFKRTIE